jgi:hypothetical protein
MKNEKYTKKNKKNKKNKNETHLKNILKKEIENLNKIKIKINVN